MFLSTTDDTTMFAFEGEVDGSYSECYIINKDNDRGLRSSYTQNTSSADSKRVFRIRHSITFNAVGNAAQLYATIYGLTEEDLPSSTCPNGVLTIPISGFCYGGCQDCSNEKTGYLVFFEEHRHIYRSSKSHEISQRNILTIRSEYEGISFKA